MRIEGKEFRTIWYENNVVKIPIVSVMENPLIGPDPIKNKIIAAISVVIFASSMVVLDFV